MEIRATGVCATLEKASRRFRLGDPAYAVQPYREGLDLDQQPGELTLSVSWEWMAALGSCAVIGFS